MADSSVRARRLSRLSGPIRPIHVPLWLGAELFGVHLAPEAIDAALRFRWGSDKPPFPVLRRRLLQPVTAAVATPDDARDRINRFGLEFGAEIGACCEDVAGLVSTALAAGELPLVLGGDHAVSWGSVAGAAREAENLGVVWIDAHADINTPASSPSGHVHGMPLAFLTGLCEAANGPLGCGSCIRPENICYLGLRDVDPFERRALVDLGIWHRSTEAWLEVGIERTIDEALAHLAARGVDALHVSFDVDVLDPRLLPGTGTPVDGGLDFEAASQVLWHLHQSKAPIQSVDLVELNPLLDRSGASTRVVVALLATLLGEPIHSVDVTTGRSRLADGGRSLTK